MYLCIPLKGETRREGDRKWMGPADSNTDAEDGKRARVTLSLLGVVMLVVGLLVVFGGLGAGDGGRDGDDTTAVAESHETETERMKSRTPRSRGSTRQSLPKRRRRRITPQRQVRR